MQVISLDIHRPASYEPDSGKLKGVVTLQSSIGQQSIILSNKSIADIFRIIAAETSIRAIRQAEAVSNTLTESAEEIIAEELSNNLLLDAI